MFCVLQEKFLLIAVLPIKTLKLGHLICEWGFAWCRHDWACSGTSWGASVPNSHIFAVCAAGAAVYSSATAPPQYPPRLALPASSSGQARSYPSGPALALRLAVSRVRNPSSPALRPFQPAAVLPSYASGPVPSWATPSAGQLVATSLGTETLLSAQFTSPPSVTHATADIGLPCIWCVECGLV